MTEPVICEKTSDHPKGCGCCHTCGTELVSQNPRTGQVRDYCTKCQAERPYESHGWTGMFTETKPCPEQVRAA